jgi:hypothetical protein
MKPKSLIIGGAIGTFTSGIIDLIVVLILKTATVYLTIALVALGQIFFLGGLIAIIIGLIRLYRLRIN